ncbi:MAG: DUF6249 domain-containing protein [Myxococcota bacterium]
MSARTLALASALLPPLCGVLAFAVLGVPQAHAAAAPSFSTEVLHLAGETMSQLLCSDGLTWGSLFEFTPLPAGHPPRAGAFGALGLGLLGLAAVVVIALGRMRLANENKRLDVAQRLIEQGMEPPANLLANPARNDLRKGIVLLFAGGGVLAAGLMTGDRGMAAGALVPEFIGAGYLVSYWLASRTHRGAS